MEQRIHDEEMNLAVCQAEVNGIGNPCTWPATVRVWSNYPLCGLHEHLRLMYAEEENLMQSVRMFAEWKREACLDEPLIDLLTRTIEDFEERLDWLAKYIEAAEQAAMN